MYLAKTNMQHTKLPETQYAGLEQEYIVVIFLARVLLPGRFHDSCVVGLTLLVVQAACRIFVGLLGKEMFLCRRHCGVLTHTLLVVPSHYIELQPQFNRLGICSFGHRRG